jgi:myo-inositol-1(or 4)-monophosphatase
MTDKELCEKVISLLEKTSTSLLLDNKNNLRIFTKKDKSLVTEKDLLIEKLLSDELQKLLPNSGVISEETTWNKKKYTWIIDPIDGTTNFIHGLNSYSISVCLGEFIGDTFQPIIGVVAEPEFRNIYYAIKSEGAFLRKNESNIKLSVSKANTLSECILSFGIPYDKSKIDNILIPTKKIVLRSQDIKRIGPASLDICRIASGQIAGYFELDLEVWDYSAAMLILLESGGEITDWSGKRINFGKNNVVASNGTIHSELLKYLVI